MSQTNVRLILLLCVSLTTGLTASLSTAQTQSPTPENAPENKKQEATQQDLVSAVQKVAKEVAKNVLNANDNTIVVGTFSTSPPGGVVSLGIKNQLVEELEKLGIKAQRNANFSCTGEISFLDKARKVTITAKIFDQRTNTTRRVTADIFNVFDLPALVGGIGLLATDLEREASFVKSITTREPDVAVSTPLPIAANTPTSPNTPATPAPLSVAKAAKAGVFGMEVVLKDAATGTFTPLPLDEEEGRLFVTLKAGQSYAIRLLNNTQHLAAATLTIDGLNMFNFSDNADYQRLGKVLVPPGEQGVIIQGWHKSNAETYSFLVARAGQPAAPGAPKALARDSERGIITAGFGFAIDVNRANDPKDPLGQFPEGEPNTLALVTEKGPIVEQEYSEVLAKFGIDREVISIHYDER